MWGVYGDGGRQGHRMGVPLILGDWIGSFRQCEPLKVLEQEGITKDSWHGHHDSGAWTEFILGHPVLRMKLGLPGSWGQGAALESTLPVIPASLWGHPPWPL